MLDRPQLSWDQESLPQVASAFWNRRLALANVDLQRAAQCMFPLMGATGFHSAAVAVSRNLVIAPAEGLPQEGLKLRLASEECPVEQIGPAKELAVLKLPVELPIFMSLAQNGPPSSLVAALGIDAERRVSLSPGWLSGAAQPFQLTHDARSTAPGAAVVSLENGSLLGVDLRPGRTLPAALIRDLLPPGTISRRSAELESVEDDFFERAKTKPEDYANREGYDPDFLGISVPLPQTDRKIVLLPYANFSVALCAVRRLSLYAVVNINGHRLVEKHRAGDPWQLDPRAPADLQVAGSYYAGTPLDRGHMVRRVDPVWGQKADQAEVDTFHYPNSCPQHKNLNRKIWNDLEDRSLGARSGHQLRQQNPVCFVDFAGTERFTLGSKFTSCRNDGHPRALKNRQLAQPLGGDCGQSRHGRDGRVLQRGQRLHDIDQQADNGCDYQQRSAQPERNLQTAAGERDDLFCVHSVLSRKTLHQGTDQQVPTVHDYKEQNL